METPFVPNWSKDHRLVTLMKSREPRPFVYIAGPYTALNGEVSIRAIKENVRLSIVCADRVMQAKGVPYIPHLTYYWDRESPKDWDTWLVYDSYWLSMCDYVVRRPGESLGADAEVSLATYLKKIIIREEEMADDFQFPAKNTI